MIARGNPPPTALNHSPDWTDKNLHRSPSRLHGTPPRNSASFWTANSTAICHRICAVPCKGLAQVENSSVQKLVRIRVNGAKGRRKVLFSLTLVVEWRRLLHFPAKMTLVQSRALPSIEKISVSYVVVPCEQWFLQAGRYGFSPVACGLEKPLLAG